MTKELKPQDGELQEKPEQQSVAPSQDVDLLELLPLAAAFFEGNMKAKEQSIQLEKEKLSIERDRLQFESEKHRSTMENRKSVFRHFFWFGLILTLFLLITSTVLMFVKNDLATGGALLSSVVALIMGLIGGWGMDKTKKGT